MGFQVWSFVNTWIGLALKAAHRRIRWTQRVDRAGTIRHSGTPGFPRKQLQTHSDGSELAILAVQCMRLHYVFTINIPPWSKHRGCLRAMRKWCVSTGVSKSQGVEGPQLFWCLVVLRPGGYNIVEIWRNMPLLTEYATWTVHQGSFSKATLWIKNTPKFHTSNEWWIEHFICLDFPSGFKHRFYATHLFIMSTLTSIVIIFHFTLKLITSK